MNENQLAFATTEVNCGTQPEFDFARAISCALMVICHTGIYLVSCENHPTFWHSMDILGNEFAAPVFMTLLGSCICFSSHSAPGKMFRRGLEIIVVGILLNIFRGFIPYLILASKGLSAPADGFVRARALLDLDILHFAGLSFMALALCRRFSVPPLVVFLAAFPLSAFGELLWGVCPKNIWGETFCNLFWFGSHESYFPFLNWFVFPAFGYFFGTMLKRCQDKDRLYRMLTSVGLMGVAATYSLLARYGMEYYSHGVYYTMGVRSGVMALFFVVFTLGASHFATSLVRDGAIRNTIIRFSRNLNSIYCISYVIIGLLVTVSVFLNFQYLPWMSIALMPVIMFASDGIAALYKSVKRGARALTRRDAASTGEPQT